MANDSDDDLDGGWDTGARSPGSRYVSKIYLMIRKILINPK